MLKFSYKFREYLRYYEEKNLGKYGGVMCFYETYKTGVYKNVCDNGCCSRLEECKISTSLGFLR